MSEDTVLCDSCGYDMTELYYEGDWECPSCNKTFIPPDGPTKDRTVSSGDMPKFSEKSDFFPVEGMSVDEINERMNAHETEIDFDEDEHAERDISFSVGDRRAISHNDKEVVGEIIDITNDGKLATLEVLDGVQINRPIEDFFLPSDDSSLDKFTDPEQLNLFSQSTNSELELGISNTTFEDFSVQLLKMIEERKKGTDGINYSLFFHTTVINLQTLLSKIFDYSLAQEQARLFTTNINRSWVKNKVYLNGECLTKINFKNNDSEASWIGLYAKRTNIGINPVEHFSDSSKSNVWIIIIHTVDSTFKVEPSDERPIKTSDIEINRWKNQCVNTLTCSVCNRESRTKSTILSETNIPMPGFCPIASCNSNNFTIDASKIGSINSSHNYQIITKSNEQNRLTLQFNTLDGAFYVTTDKLADEIDVIELWDEFQNSGSMEESMAKYSPADHKSSKLEELLDLELKLHRTSADLYAKLRGIPLTLGSKSKTDLSLTLQELYWLDEQLIRVQKKIR
jgi:hypothetical protein